MKIKSRLLLVLGFVLLGIGALGIILPVLPTTPFVLAAAGCFSGNAKMTAWLKKSRVFSDYIINYKERNGLEKRSVIISLTSLWLMLGISIVLLKMLWASIVLPCIGITVTIHILHMARPKKKLAKKESSKANNLSH